MTNLVLYLSIPLMMSVHTNDWVDIGYGVMYHPVLMTNYHQQSIVETNLFVIIPATNAVGVPFNYEISLGQTTFTNLKDSPTPANPMGMRAASLPGSISIHRIEAPPIPK